MKLVQKLPAALAVACVMMMSSCSKENDQAPAPKVESANENSNLKVDAFAYAPSIASTQWYLGENILPANWDRNISQFSSNQVSYPVGVSSISKLWGDPSKPFVQSMCLLPAAPNITTFITVTTSGIMNKGAKSSVKTKIRHLTPGKKYALTLYVGSSLPKANTTGHMATFAKQAYLSVQDVNSYQDAIVDLSNMYNAWYPKVFTFTAHSQEVDFAFSASPGAPGQYSYAHLLVPNNAIKLVN